MPIIRTPAIICTVRRHGEHGAVVRLFTPDHGLQSGYVRGGRSTALRPVLMPANLVTAELRSRVNDQLAGLTVELAESRAPFYSEPLAAAAFEWGTLLTRHRRAGGSAVPAALCGAGGLTRSGLCGPPRRAGGCARWCVTRALLLAELGFGLDLERCAVTGERADLAYVSPRTGRAVSRHAAGGLCGKAAGAALRS
jgi:DNA repair protein RecO (recombination protein O)